MKLYQIWQEGMYTSGGFREGYDEPKDGVDTIFTTYEKALEHLPKSYSNMSCGEYCNYYVKEIEVE